MNQLFIKFTELSYLYWVHLSLSLSLSLLDSFCSDLEVVLFIVFAHMRKKAGLCTLQYRTEVGLFVTNSFFSLCSLNMYV